VVYRDGNSIVREWERVKVLVEIIEDIVEFFRSGCGDRVKGSNNGSRLNEYFVDFGNRCEEWDGGWMGLVIKSKERCEMWSVSGEEVDDVGRECNKKLIVWYKRVSDIENIIECIFVGTFGVEGEDSVEGVNRVRGKEDEYEVIEQDIEDDGSLIQLCELWCFELRCGVFLES
jgi:hypothetical protein